MEEGNKKTTRSAVNWPPLVGLILVFAAIFGFILFLQNGETVVTGEFDKPEKRESLTCEADNIPYSVFDYDSAKEKNLKINITFSDNSLDSVSLVYWLKYDDEEELEYSEARNHAVMNQKFDKDGMAPDSLSAKYSVIDGGIQFSIFASGSDINNKSLRYFLLDRVIDIKSITLEKLAKIYNEAGLNCDMKR